MPTTFPKTFKRKRGVPVRPRRGNAPPPRVTTAQFSIYHGTDRAGSFRRAGDSSFEAFDRRGRPLGRFTTQREALAVIEREALS